VNSPLTKDEKRAIVKLKALDPKLGIRTIAKKVGRSKNTVYRVMSDAKFQDYIRAEKKKIDKVRIDVIKEIDKSLLPDISKMSAWQKVGAAKTYYEQVFGMQVNPQVGINVAGNNVAVQLVRGNLNSTNSKSPEMPVFHKSE
jgi:hypothetical protein